jgi:hypothetical protein
VRTIKVAYCKICKKEVSPSTKPLDTWEKVAWALISLVTVGIGFIVYLLYHFKYLKKKYCPICYVPVTFKTEEEKEKEEKEKPKFDTSTAKGKVLEKVDKVKKQPKPTKQPEKEFCEFCGSQIPSSASVCPSCKTVFNK